MPISRQTLTTLSGVWPRTQQTYDARAKAQAERCLAVGAVETAVLSHADAATSAQISASASGQEGMWKNGRAGFRFCDHLGRQGEKGKVYYARRLPNRYSGPHAAASGHGRHRLNRQLADLRQKGEGSGQSWQGKRGRSGTPLMGQVEPICWPIYWHGHGQSRGVII